MVLAVSILPLLAPAVIVTISAAAFYGLPRLRSPAEVSIVVLRPLLSMQFWAGAGSRGRAATTMPGREPVIEPGTI
jgi:hypothetical protein